jgi:hypothetical protein
MRSFLVILAAVALTATSVAAQDPTVPPRPKSVSLGGPRFGVTMLSGESARIAKEDYGVERSVVTQFGWQFERRFFSKENGPSGIFEWVVLVGGLEQGAFFPSISWITGVRTASGVEFGVGPNATPLGVGFAAAAGITIPAGYMQFPFNVAVVSSANGVRVSALAGFTTR